MVADVNTNHGKIIKLHKLKLINIKLRNEPGSINTDAI